jgi:phosphoglycerate kinase
VARRRRTLADLSETDLKGVGVLVRVDFNVPLGEDGEVADATRIDATLPTIRDLAEAGARVLLVSHLGRPDGERDPAASLAPAARVLSDRLGFPVPLLEAPPGSPELKSAVGNVGSGQVALLENVRFHPGETRNDPELAGALAELAQVFVGDAFGVSHRAHASNVGAAEAIRKKGGPVVAGHLMRKELRFLREALEAPERPFVAVLGGAKISGKIELIEAILPQTDRVLVGGAMANTFLKALGLEVGRSLIEPERVDMARELLDRAGDRLMLPVDVVVAEAIEPGASVRSVDRDAIGPEERIGDIGPDTRSLFEREIRGARTVLWNGPMGVFEMAPFAEGTFAVARSIAEATGTGALTVIGGGDSAAAAEAAGVADRMSHISTGGGASLDLMAGKALPGVEVLDMVEGEGE